MRTRWFLGSVALLCFAPVAWADSRPDTSASPEPAVCAPLVTHGIEPVLAPSSADYLKDHPKALAVIIEKLSDPGSLRRFESLVLTRLTLEGAQVSSKLQVEPHLQFTVLYEPSGGGHSISVTGKLMFDDALARVVILEMSSQVLPAELPRIADEPTTTSRAVEKKVKQIVEAAQTQNDSPSYSVFDPDTYSDVAMRRALAERLPDEDDLQYETISGTAVLDFLESPSFAVQLGGASDGVGEKLRALHTEGLLRGIFLRRVATGVETTFAPYFVHAFVTFNTKADPAGYALKLNYSLGD